MSAIRADHRALTLMVVLAVVVAFVHFNPLGIAKPLEDINILECDGQTVTLDGRRAELLRLHNEARAEHVGGELCVQENLVAAAQGPVENIIRRDF